MLLHSCVANSITEVTTHPLDNPYNMVCSASFPHHASYTVHCANIMPLESRYLWSPPPVLVNTAYFYYTRQKIRHILLTRFHLITVKMLSAKCRLFCSKFNISYFLCPRSWFVIKKPSHWYRDFHYKATTQGRLIKQYICLKDCLSIEMRPWVSDYLHQFQIHKSPELPPQPTRCWTSTS